MIISILTLKHIISKRTPNSYTELKLFVYMFNHYINYVHICICPDVLVLFS